MDKTAVNGSKSAAKGIWEKKPTTAITTTKGTFCQLILKFLLDDLKVMFFFNFLGT